MSRKSTRRSDSQQLLTILRGRREKYAVPPPAATVPGEANAFVEHDLPPAEQAPEGPQSVAAEEQAPGVASLQPMPSQGQPLPGGPQLATSSGQMATSTGQPDQTQQEAPGAAQTPTGSQEAPTPQAAPAGQQEPQPPAPGEQPQAENPDHARILSRLRELSPLMRGAQISLDPAGVIFQVPGSGGVRIRYERPGELEQLAQENNAAWMQSNRAAGGYAGAPSGAYRNREIILSQDATADEFAHEIIHGMQDLGLISRQEVEQFGGAEEMAYAYQDWVKQGEGREPNSILERIAAFLSRAIDALGAAFGGQRSQQRQLLRNFSFDRMTPPTLPLTSVHPDEPLGAMRSDGTINTASVLFATRGWKQWANSFMNSPAAQQVYSPNEMRDLIAGMASTARLFGDFGSVPEEVPGGPLRENMDPLFKFTIDSSTICPKQDVYVGAIRELQKRNGRVFNRDERMRIGQILLGLGEGRACWYCYGQAGRDRGAEMLNKMKAIADDLHRDAASGKLRQMLDPRTPKALTKPYWDAVSREYKLDGQLMTHLKETAYDPEAHKFWSDMPTLHDKVFNYQQAEQGMEAKTVKAIWTVLSGSSVNKPKGFSVYKNQLLSKSNNMKRKLDEANLSAGIRLNSQTDFRVWHVLELQQILMHARMRNSQVHAYTRAPAFLNIFGKTGIKFNLSCAYAHDRNGRVMVDERGRPHWDMLSFPRDVGLAHRATNPNVGTMLTPQTIEDFWTGLDDDNIDIMIPYHRGAVAKEADAYMGAVDFSLYQHEIWPGAGKIGKKLGGDYYIPTTKELKKGKPYQFTTKTLADGTVITLQTGQPITREHYNPDVRGRERQLSEGGYMPSLDEYHEKERYLEICDAFGIIPKFPQACGRGDRVKAIDPDHPLNQFNEDHPAYMKLVRDVATGSARITEDEEHPDFGYAQTVVDPRKINFENAEDHVNAFTGGGGQAAIEERAVREGLMDVIQTMIDNGELDNAKTKLVDGSGLGGVIQIGRVMDPAYGQKKMTAAASTKPARRPKFGSVPPEDKPPDSGTPASEADFRAVLHALEMQGHLQQNPDLVEQFRKADKFSQLQRMRVRRRVF